MWAEGENVPAVHEELQEVLREWVELRFSRDLYVPKVGEGGR